MDFFGSLVLGLMLAGSAAPAWVGWLGALSILGGVAILTWVVRGWWDSRGVELEAEPLPPSGTPLPALYEETAARSRERPLSPRHRAPRSHVVPAHPANDTTVVIPSVDETVLLSKPSGRRGAR
jgi:hypothetical protein